MNVLSGNSYIAQPPRKSNGMNKTKCRQVDSTPQVRQETVWSWRGPRTSKGYYLVSYSDW